MQQAEAKRPGAINAACLALGKSSLEPIKPVRHAADVTPPALLNEGQAAALLGIGRRKFHDVRQQPWFVAECTAIELGPRALRWHRDELLAAARKAPRVTKQAEPAQFVTKRAERDKAVA
jgi:hypothetical protein